ncbi:hypothetical protein GE09DRAFT_1050772 [Coniochaeta sp. 2T2.1]|nr:hypothetical protein GE09DRAFT_1050772 [Coniochaeta sp. 2T2.1]
MCFGTGPRQEYYGEEIVATRPYKAAAHHSHSHNHSHDSQQHHHSHNSHHHHHHHNSTSRSPTPRASYHSSSRQVQYGPSPRTSTTVYRTSGPEVYETTTTRTRAA